MPEKRLLIPHNLKIDIKTVNRSTVYKLWTTIIGIDPDLDIDPVVTGRYLVYQGLPQTKIQIGTDNIAVLSEVSIPVFTQSKSHNSLISESVNILQTNPFSTEVKEDHPIPDEIVRNGEPAKTLSLTPEEVVAEEVVSEEIVSEEVITEKLEVVKTHKELVESKTAAPIIIQESKLKGDVPFDKKMETFTKEDLYQIYLDGKAQKNVNTARIENGQKASILLAQKGWDEVAKSNAKTKWMSDFTMQRVKPNMGVLQEFSPGVNKVDGVLQSGLFFYMTIDNSLAKQTKDFLNKENITNGIFDLLNKHLPGGVQIKSVSTDDVRGYQPKAFDNILKAFWTLDKVVGTRIKDDYQKYYKPPSGSVTLRSVDFNPLEV